MKKKWLNMRRNKYKFCGNRDSKAAGPLLVAAGTTMLLSPFIGTEAAFLVGMTLGYMLFPKDNNTQMPEVSTYPIQRSDKGTPIQIVMGTRKVSGNVIWLGEMHPYTIKISSGGGGKGLGGGDSIDTIEVRYRRSFLISICHGEAHIRRVWAGKEEIPIDSLTEFDGSDNESDILAVTGETYGTYRYITCAFFNEYELGTNGGLPNFTFEMTSDPVIYATSHFALSAKHFVLDQNFALVLEETSVAGGFATDIAPGGSGRYIISQGWDEAASRLPIFIFDIDNMDLEIPFDWGTISGQSGITVGATFSKDGQYVYVAMQSGSGDSHVMKWNTTTGELIWQFSDSRIVPYFMRVDEFENIYLRSLGPTAFSEEPGYLDGSDGTIAGYYSGIITANGGPVYDSAIHGGFIYWGGKDLSTPFNNIWKCSLPTSQGGEAGSLITSLSVDDDNSPIFNIIVNENGVYFIKGFKVIKYNLELTIREAETTITPNPTGYLSNLCFDQQKNIILKMAGGELGTNYSIVKFDKDLVRIQGYDNAGIAFRTYGGLYASESFILPTYVLLTGITDVNPVDVIRALLTNERYGAKIDADLYIDNDSFITAKLYCSDQNILCSFVFKARKPVLDHIDYVLSHFQGYLFMSDGKINIGIYKEETSTFEIGRDNLVVDNVEDPEPPVNITKRKYSETNNRVEITWTNRDAEYDTSVAVANEEVDQRISGDVRIKTINLQGITNADLAQMMAFRYLAESMYRFSLYSFTLSYKNMLLETGDVGTLNDGYAVSDAIVRITSISEDKDGRGLAIQAVEDGNYMYQVLRGNFSTEDTDHVETPVVQVSDLVAPEINFLQSRLNNKINMSFAPMASEVNGWNWYRSWDDVSYELMGRVNSGEVTEGWNVVGHINNLLPEYPSVIHRPIDSIEVSLGDSVGLLDTSITDAQFFGEKKLCKVGDEIIAYKDIEDVSFDDITVTTPGGTGESRDFLDGFYTDDSSFLVTLRIAIPITPNENYSCTGIRLLHSGANSNLMLVGLYADDGSGLGKPGARLALSVETAMEATGKHWQTIDFITPVDVIAGTTYWACFVQDNSPGNFIYYDVLIEYARANSADTWGGGMPDPYGASTQGTAYYCVNMVGHSDSADDVTYEGEDEGDKTGNSTTNSFAQKVTLTDDMEITHVDFYHTWDTSAVTMIVALYDNTGATGGPGARLAISALTPKDIGCGWQRFELLVPYSASSGEEIFTAFISSINSIMGRYNDVGASRSWYSDVWPAGLPDPWVGTNRSGQHRYSGRLVNVTPSAGGEPIVTVYPGRSNRFKISNLIRGMYGTKAIIHNPSDVFVTLDENTTLEFDDIDIGRKFWIKALTFYGTKVMDIGDVTGVSDILKGLGSRPGPASMLRLTSDINDRIDNKFYGEEFDVYWSLNSKDTGYNRGGYDIHSDITDGIWRYGDDEALLKSGNGVLYGSYTVDPELVGVNFQLRISGVLVYESELGVVETHDMNTSDVGSSDTFVVTVTPKRSLFTLRTNDITISGE